MHVIFSTLHLTALHHSGTIMDATLSLMLVISLMGSEGFPGLRKPSPATPEVGNVRGRWYQTSGRYDSGTPPGKSEAQPIGRDGLYSSGTPMDFSSSQVIKAENKGQRPFNGQRDVQYSSGTPLVSSISQAWNAGAPGLVSQFNSLNGQRGAIQVEQFNSSFNGQTGAQYSCSDGQCSGSQSKSHDSQDIRQRRNTTESNWRTPARRFGPNKQKRNAGQHSSSAPWSSVPQNTKKKRSLSTCPDLSATLVQKPYQYHYHLPRYHTIPLPLAAIPCPDSTAYCSSQYSQPIVEVFPCCQKTCVAKNTTSSSFISSSDKSTSSNTTSRSNSTDSSNTTSTTCVSTAPSTNTTSVCVYSNAANPYNCCYVNAADVISQLIDTIGKLYQGSANSASNVNVTINLKGPNEPADCNEGSSTISGCSYLSMK